MNTLPIEDLCNTYLEHSIVIHNFVIKVGSQIHDSLCRVFGGTVQYEWRENDDKVIVPDVSIIVSAKYSCGFSNLLDSSIIVNER